MQLTLVIVMPKLFLSLSTTLDTLIPARWAVCVSLKASYSSLNYACSLYHTSILKYLYIHHSLSSHVLRPHSVNLPDFCGLSFMSMKWDTQKNADDSAEYRFIIRREIWTCSKFTFWAYNKGQPWSRNVAAWKDLTYCVILCDLCKFPSCKGKDVPVAHSASDTYVKMMMWWLLKYQQWRNRFSSWKYE